MIVVDASVLANALTYDGAVGARARIELARDTHWAAPEHLLAEAFSAIRGRWLGHTISEHRARDALATLTVATIDLVSTAPLLERMWGLRRYVTGYDAAYLAVAEAFNCAPVTADVRLSRVPEIRCEIRLALPAA